MFDFDKPFYETLMGRIATALPGAWTLDLLDFGDGVATSPTDSEQRLHFTPLANQGRLQIWGGLGQYTRLHPWHTGPKLSITVAATREPAALARDIQRRLLPEYIAALTAARQRHEQIVARVQREQHIAAALAAGFGGSVRVYDHAPASFSGSPKGHEGSPSPHVQGDITGESVTLKFTSLTPDQATRLVHALQGAG